MVWNVSCMFYSGLTEKTNPANHLINLRRGSYRNLIRKSAESIQESLPENITDFSGHNEKDSINIRFVGSAVKWRCTSGSAYKQQRWRQGKNIMTFRKKHSF
jgi:hypothetical protein